MAKKILIVDDEEVIRDSVKLCLEGCGYELYEAENGEQGLERARELKPHLIILDLMMPDKWGYAVCEELRGHPDTRDAIIMFLTARGSAPSRKVGDLKGADDYMVKPFIPDELREKVKGLLSP